MLVIAAMALSAVAYRGWFRLYALATIAVVVGFGMASAFAIQGIEHAVVLRPVDTAAAADLGRDSRRDHP